MNLFKDKLNEGDIVYCIINPAIEGEITKKLNYHGQYQYTIKMLKDGSGFYKWFNVRIANAVFLHWQLAKIYKEVKKVGRKDKRKTRETRKRI